MSLVAETAKNDVTEDSYIYRASEPWAHQRQF